jgi:hypothetical protein
MHVVVHEDGSVTETAKINNHDIEPDEQPDEESEWKVTTKNIQFKQISVGSDISCGIAYTSADLYCWGYRLHRGTHVVEPIKGPFKQVSMSSLGVCTIRATEETLQCFGTYINAKLNGADPSIQFDQIKVADVGMCAVDVYSQLHCWAESELRIESPDIVIA